MEIVWCFDANLYSNLVWFGAPIRIFHPVDPITRSFQLRPAESATLVLTVSDKILSAFDGIAPRVARSVVNHGVNEILAEIARAGLAYDPWNGPVVRPRIGYVGNLSRPDIDRDLLLDLVNAFPQADFIFFAAPYTASVETARLIAPSLREGAIYADISNTPPEANNPFPGAYRFTSATGAQDVVHWHASRNHHALLLQPG